MLRLAVQILTLLTIANANSFDKFEYKDHLLILNDDNFDLALKKFPYLLVAFTVDTCGQCELVREDFKKATEIIDKENYDFHVGEVDVSNSDRLVQIHIRRAVPTIKFFKNGTEIWYSGERTAHGYVNWIKGKVAPQAKELSSFGETQNFLDEHKVAVIGFFKDAESTKAITFKAIADSMEGLNFAYTTNPSVSKRLGVKGESIAIFKSQDETSIYEGDYSNNDLVNWIPKNSLPLVVYYQAEISNLIFDKIKQPLHFYLFISMNDEDYDDLKKEVEKTALEFKEKLLFVIMDSTRRDVDHVIEYFRLDRGDLPEIRICNLTKEPFVKYRPDFEMVTAEKLKKFVQDFLDGKLSPYILSEELPDDWDKGPIVTLSIKNMDSYIEQSELDVVLLMHKKQCETSAAYLDIWKRLAKEFGNNDNFILATIDESKNELANSGEQISPMVILFRKENHMPYIYKGAASENEVKAFIQSRGNEIAHEKEEVENVKAPEKQESFTDTRSEL